MTVHEQVSAVLFFELGYFAVTSPLTMAELFHSARSNVDEKTYFLMALSLSAQGWIRPVRQPHLAL